MTASPVEVDRVSVRRMIGWVGLLAAGLLATGMASAPLLAAGSSASAPASTAASAPASTAASAPASMAASAPTAALVPPEEPPPLGETPFGEKRSIDNPYTALLRVVLVLAGVILLIYLVLQKGLGSLTNRMTKGRLLRVVDRIGLEPKKVLYVVEVAGRYYLIGTTDHGVSCLATLGPDGQPPPAFEELLRGKAAPVPPAAAASATGAAPGPAPAQGGLDE